MTNRRTFLQLATMPAAALAFGQTTSLQPRQADSSAFVGVWRCNLDNLPALVLTISDEGGSLSGAALFYLHKRKSIGEPWTSTPGVPQPLFQLKTEGKTLGFQISHRRAHPPGSLSDPPVRFRLTLTGSDKAMLVNDKERNGQPFAMARSDY
jgi:hypothetical protein